MFISVILLIMGFALLLLGADWLVKGASSLALRFRLPETIIGLTVVALGTSTPEMVVNIASSLKGMPDLVLANVVGSNNFDLLVVLGVSSLIFPLDGHKGTTWKEIPFLLIVSVILVLLGNDKMMDANAANLLTRWDALILLLLFVLFIIYTEHLSRTVDSEVSDVKIYPVYLTAGMILGGLGLLAGGVELVVEKAVFLTKEFGMSEKIIGLTIVAGGTSLPELITSAVAAFKKHPEIAIGNIIGSATFNVLLILGVSALITPIPYDTSFNIDIGVMLLGILLLFIYMFIGKKHSIDRWQGAKLLIIYLVYLGFLLR